MEEERRLCYVGFTRARKTLYVSHALSRVRYDKIMRNAPSRFLEEVPLTHVVPVNSYGRAKEVHRSAAASGLSSITPRQAMPFPAQRPSPPRPVPKTATINFAIGDKVKMAKYGVGEVVAIYPAGADFEVTIKFETAGRKKFMANLLKITKV